MAMSLSEPHPTDPHSETGIKLGDDQFAQAPDWESAGRLALVGMGVEPGLSDVFARYAADHLFGEIDELGTRDGANLVVRDEAGNEIFAPSFSIWTTIEECLNPPVIWEKDRGWFTTPPFSEPEVFTFPDGHRRRRVRQRRARGGAADAALGRREARHLQVRARQRVHRHPQDAAPARPRQDRAAARALGRRPRDGRAARRGRGGPARPGDARTADDRQDLRGPLGHRHRQGRQAARGVPVSRERQRVDDGRVREPVRRVADRAQPGDRARAARDRGLGGCGRARPGGVRREAVPRPDGEEPRRMVGTGRRGGSRIGWRSTGQPSAQ